MTTEKTGWQENLGPKKIPVYAINIYHIYHPKKQVFCMQNQVTFNVGHKLSDKEVFGRQSFEYSMKQERSSYSKSRSMGNTFISSVVLCNSQA